MSVHFSRANMDSGGPIRIQEGQYGFRRVNTDSVGPIQNCLWILGWPIQTCLWVLILGGPIQKLIRNCQREITWSSPASWRKTPSFFPLLLRLTHSHIYLLSQDFHYYDVEVFTVVSLFTLFSILLLICFDSLQSCL